jgi:Dolichyl-phosphate-mannose-protein mannosyltransferase
MKGDEPDIRFRDVAPAIEFVCWVVVLLCPLLRLANGPAVTDDQFVFQVTMFTVALFAGLFLRIYQARCRPAGLRRGSAFYIGFDRIRAAFAAFYNALGQAHIARRAIASLLVVHSALLVYSAYVHSPTLNEPGHLVAGLSHWKFGRFDVYPVNPPFVKMIAALPVIAVGYHENWSDFVDAPGARPEMAMGAAFVKANAERSRYLFAIARWACIPFSWLGAIVCYLWARDLYGRPSGVMAAAIWCFEPNILAHASLITPDVGATALGLAATYRFWRWLKHPTWLQAAFTGIVLGLAELAKTTLIVFYPLWPLMWLIYRWPERRRMARRDWIREAGMLALAMSISIYVLNLGYGFEGSLTQLKEFHFVSDLFTGRGSRVDGREPENPQSPIRDPQSPGNRFNDTCLGQLPIPFPKNYLLGIDIQQRDFEHYGQPSYLHGVWQCHGWWYYYLYASAIKVPLGLWLLGALSGLIALKDRRATHRLSQSKGSALATIHVGDLAVLLVPAAVLFAVVSSETGFNEHMRYVLPAFPYLFIWVAGVAEKLVDSGGLGSKL